MGYSPAIFEADHISIAGVTFILSDGNYTRFFFVGGDGMGYYILC